MRPLSLHVDIVGTVDHNTDESDIFLQLRPFPLPRTPIRRPGRVHGSSLSTSAASASTPQRSHVGHRKDSRPDPPVPHAPEPAVVSLVHHHKARPGETDLDELLRASPPDRCRLGHDLVPHLAWRRSCRPAHSRSLMSTETPSLALAPESSPGSRPLRDHRPEQNARRHSRWSRRVRG